MDGWFSVHRKITNHAVYSDPEVFRLFTLCLVKATYVQRSVAIGAQKVELEPGQFITGRDALAEEYNVGLKNKNGRVSSRTIWRWVKWLETWGCLSCKSSNKFTVITVVNWAQYQETDAQPVQQIDHQIVQQASSTCPTGVQLVSTNNKEIKKQGNKETSKDKKIAFAEFVHMTQEEYDKLVDRLGEDVTKAYIDRLDNYKGAKGKKYASDYRAILTWLSKDNDRAGGNDVTRNDRNNARQPNEAERDELAAVEESFFSPTGT